MPYLRKGFYLGGVRFELAASEGEDFGDGSAYPISITTKPYGYRTGSRRRGVTVEREGSYWGYMGGSGKGSKRDGMVLGGW